MLLGAIIGDALGTPLDGMSGGHIRAVFGEIAGYIDPEKGLKNRMERWKKPALYSSLSQLMLLASFPAAGRRGPELLPAVTMESFPALENSDFGIFRHPGSAIRDFLRKRGFKHGETGAPQDSPDTAPVIVVAPLAAEGPPRDLELLQTARASALTRNAHAVAGAVLVSKLLLLLSGVEGAGSPLAAAMRAAGETVAAFKDKTAEIFDLGLNPDSLIEAAGDFLRVLPAAERATSLDNAEKEIAEKTNPVLRSPVSRATVNHPLLVIPLAVCALDIYCDIPEKAPCAVASRGGAAAITGSLTGMLVGAAFGDSCIPEDLLRGLVNRKTVITCVEAIADGSVPADMVSRFIEGEIPLTAKEAAEYHARLRHYTPRKKKAPKTRGDAERELSRHVVESWTKLDRAKWKKERERRNRSDE